MLAIAVTGHRKIVPSVGMSPPWPNANPAVREHHLNMTRAIQDWVTFQSKGFDYTDCISGLALGADQIFAQAAINLRDSGLPIRLIGASPFPSQPSNWPIASQQNYRRIISLCDHVIQVNPDPYAAWKMQARNKWMVDHAHLVLAIWDGTQQGGTWNCIQYALSLKNKLVIVMNPYTFELLPLK